MPSLDFEVERAAFKEYYATHYPTLRAAEKSYRNLIQLLLTDHAEFPTPKVVSRIKDRDECIGKFVRKYRAGFEDAGQPYAIKDSITDLIGLRVICLYEPDIYKVEGVLHGNFDLIDKTDKVIAIKEKENQFGYMGLHLDLIFDSSRSGLPEYKSFDGLAFEVQIRTIVQDAWSEIDHKLKYKKSIPVNLKRRINTLAALFELADREFVAIRHETDTLEQKALSQPQPKEAKPLDAFNFLPVAQKAFPGFPFQPEKVDGFVNEIIGLNPDVTDQDLSQAFKAQASKVEEYANYQDSIGNRLNPFTQIRHILCAYKSSIYEDMLFEGIRGNFQRWLTTGSVFPSNHQDA